MKPHVIPSLIILAAVSGLGLQAQQPSVTAKQTQPPPAKVPADSQYPVETVTIKEGCHVSES